MDFSKIKEISSGHIVNRMMQLDKLAREFWKKDGMTKDSTVMVDSLTPAYVARQTWRNYLPNEYWLLEAEAKKRGLI